MDVTSLIHTPPTIHMESSTKHCVVLFVVEKNKKMACDESGVLL